MTHNIQSEPLTFEDLKARYEQVRGRLEAAEEALRAIQGGEVDALVISTEEGEQIFTLEGADYTYRVMVENISEGVANLTGDGTLLYGNQRLADMLGVPLESLPGSNLLRFILPSDRPVYHSLLQRAQGRSSQREITCSGRTAPGCS
jgi:PAS domain-containing protein